MRYINLFLFTYWLKNQREHAPFDSMTEAPEATYRTELATGYSTKSVTHGRCDAILPVTFLAAEHHCPFIVTTELHCIVTEAGVRERLAQGCTRQRNGWYSNPQPLDRQFDALTTRLPSHTNFTAACTWYRDLSSGPTFSGHRNNSAKQLRHEFTTIKKVQHKTLFQHCMTDNMVQTGCHSLSTGPTEGLTSWWLINWSSINQSIYRGNFLQCLL